MMRQLKASGERSGALLIAALVGLLCPFVPATSGSSLALAAPVADSASAGAVETAGANDASSAATAADVSAALDWLNAQRQATGAPAVTLDDSLSAGATAHASYLVQHANEPAVAGLRAHEEDASLSGATTAGATAAKNSNISRGTASVVAAIKGLTNVPLHRQGMLNPTVRRIGIGYAPYAAPDQSDASRSAEHGLAVVVDVIGGIDRDAPARVDQPVVYPVPGQTDVPVAFASETPDPRDATPGKGTEVGFAISVEPSCGTLGAPKSVQLQDDLGRDVPIWTVNPGTVLEAVGGSRTVKQILTFSQQPLQGGTTYHVHIVGQCNKKDFDLDWRFTTAGPKLTTDATGETVVRVPEDLDFAKATDRYGTYTDTQREKGVVLVFARTTPLPEQAWQRLYGWNVHPQMSDGGPVDVRLLRPTSGTTFQGADLGWDYENGPKFATTLRERWNELHPWTWGAPTGPVTVEGNAWVLRFANGTTLRWPQGATTATVEASATTSPTSENASKP